MCKNTYQGISRFEVFAAALLSAISVLLYVVYTAVHLSQNVPELETVLLLFVSQTHPTLLVLFANVVILK